MNEILEQEIGLTFGLINEKNNQMIDTDKDKIVNGTADMLMAG